MELDDDGRVDEGNERVTRQDGANAAAAEGVACHYDDDDASDGDEDDDTGDTFTLVHEEDSEDKSLLRHGHLVDLVHVDGDDASRAHQEQDRQNDRTAGCNNIRESRLSFGHRRHVAYLSQWHQ